MLAKIWKKLLMAICIIACIYNVMHKLVSRTSLEEQLKSVQEQTSLIDNNQNEKEDAKGKEEQKLVREEETEEKDEGTVVLIN